MNRIYRLIVAGALLVVALIVFMLPALAQDGRINQADNLGGYAIYCVDSNLNPALHYNEGGIRVLTASGAEALFVPNADIVAVGEPAENTLLGSAGSLSLYRLGGFPYYFQLNGVDDSGKEFAYLWLECDQSAPAPTPTPCVPVYLSSPTEFGAYIDPCCPVLGSAPLDLSLSGREGAPSELAYDPCYPK